MNNRTAVFSWGSVEAETLGELRTFLDGYAKMHAAAYSKKRKSHSNAHISGASELANLAEWTGLEPATPGVTGPRQK